MPALKTDGIALNNRLSCVKQRCIGHAGWHSISSEFKWSLRKMLKLNNRDSIVF